MVIEPKRPADICASQDASDVREMFVERTTRIKRGRESSYGRN
jgi:hypothetical protein